MEINLKGKKFIPLRDFVLGKQQTKKVEEVTNNLGLITSVTDINKLGTEQPTPILDVVKIGAKIEERDKIKEGSEVVFDMRGVDLEIDGEKFKLVKENNIIGVLE